ncbi:M23 family metallopeptidase [Microbacterium lacus]|uniref:murein hydrolase activator EnvC family protein n=1 Tax=Microbacterium lacus TaxID=415217 RepID=UPI003850CE3A
MRSRDASLRVLMLTTVLALTIAWAFPPLATAEASPHGAAPVGLADRGWIWPATQFRVESSYVAPAHEYGPGHRGIDLRLTGTSDLRAPAAGTVAFSGDVADRGILTIDHGDGLVTTLEPIDSALNPGDAVAHGDAVGVLAAGGHSSAGSVHFGVRLHGEYINPLLLLGGVPRAILLPCCD